MSTISELANRRRRAERFESALQACARRSGNGTSMSSDAPAPAPLEQLAEVAGVLRHAGVSDRTAGPRPAFRDGLRAILLAEAAVRAVSLPEPRAHDEASTSRPARAARPLPAGAPAIRRQLAAGGVAFSLLAASGVLASQSALPGQHLYPVKRGVESLQLGVAQGDHERGIHLLAQASTRTREVQRLLDDGRAGGGSPSVAQSSAALTSAVHNLHAGRVLLLRAYAAGDVEALRTLAGFVSDQRDLVDALARVLPDELAPQLRRLRAEVDATADDVQRVRAACGAPCESDSDAHAADQPASFPAGAEGRITAAARTPVVAVPTPEPAPVAPATSAPAPVDAPKDVTFESPARAVTSTPASPASPAGAGTAATSASASDSDPEPSTPAPATAEPTMGNAAVDLAATDSGLAGTTVAARVTTPTSVPAAVPVAADPAPVAAPTAAVIAPAETAPDTLALPPSDLLAAGSPAPVTGSTQSTNSTPSTTQNTGGVQGATAPAPSSVNGETTSSEVATAADAVASPNAGANSASASPADTVPVAAPVPADASGAFAAPSDPQT